MNTKLYSAILIGAVLFLGNACSKNTTALTGRENSDQAINKCIKLSKKKRFTEAVDCLEIFKSRFPESPHAQTAELQIADSYFRGKEWLLAAESYILFAKTHPSSPKVDYALFRAGLSYEKQLPRGVDRDMSSLKKAQETFALVFRQFPNSPYRNMAQAKYDEMRARSARKHYYVGRFYYRTGEYRAAIPRFIAILQDYPGLGYDEETLYKLTYSYQKLGLHDKARAAAELLLEKFPNSRKAQRTQKNLKTAQGGTEDQRG